jgi:DNA repair exonuclease SbcCD ATPase subunit
MRTHPTPASSNSDTTISSLDRTDVLPVLDVEAYEETLIENAKTLSRTDTWTVDALQDIDELIESVTHEAPVEVRSVNVNRETPKSEGFTVNVDRILKRIADLEADIVQAHDANAVMLKRNDALQVERDQHAARIDALTAEQSRLAEHRALAEEMAQRSEKQLRDEVQKLEARIKDSDRALTAEKASAADLARRFAAKLSEHDKLVAIIEQHNRQIDEIVTVRDDLDQRLRRELEAAVDLKAKLAAAEESVGANRALLLEREGALAEEGRKQSALAAQITELRDSLQKAEGKVQDAHREVTVAAKARGDEERRRVELEKQLHEAHGKLDAVAAARDAAQAQVRALTNERNALLPAASELTARTAELERSNGTILKLRDELAAAQMDAQASEQLAQERADELVALRGTIEERDGTVRQLEEELHAQGQAAETLRTQLQTAHEECAIMADQREKARARAKQLTQEIFRRDHKIEELQADLAVHSEALAAIRRDVNRIGEKASSPPVVEEVEWLLEPIEHAGDMLRLTGTMLTIGRTAENDIALASKMVSRHHARLLIGPTGIIVEDAGSTNGCFVNGEQVKQHLMHDGDVLELGDLRYRLRLKSARDTAVRANVVPLFEQNPD